MILKEYQKRALDCVADFVEQPAMWREKAAKAREVDPELTFDWVGRTWESTAPNRSYLSRRNGLGEPLPSFCLKIRLSSNECG